MSETKKKKRSIFSFFKGKKFRHGGFSILLTALFIALVVILNVVAGAAEEKWGLRIDATANKLTSFSDHTYSTLDALGEDVYIYVIYQEGTQNDRRVQLEETINKYQARSSHIKVDTIDPLREPNRLNKYSESDSTKSLSDGAVVVTNADETRVKLITSSEFINYSYDSSSGNYYITGYNWESKLTTALMYVTSKTTPIVYFLTGHDEYASSSCSILKSQLESENYDVMDLTLGPNVELKAGDTMLINVPGKDLTDDEYAQLKDFLNNGGRMMYVHEYSIDMDKMPNLKSLLNYYSVSFEKGYVVEDETATSNWLSMPTYLIPTMDSEDDITSNLSTLGRMLLPYSGAIKSPDMPLSGYRYTNLLTSSASSYFKESANTSGTMSREEGDRSGPFTLAMSIYHQEDTSDSTKDTRIVLIANPYATVDNSFLNATINLDFTMNALDWLSDREISVYIRAKSNADTALNIPDSGTFWMLAAIIVVVIPAFVLIFGIVVYLRRRRL